jgi:D-alanyl-D-alanine carboxypeptidase/D-alanyl-D-alanine-endopeptidase (penicillin-binding protein 4)
VVAVLAALLAALTLSTPAHARIDAPTPDLGKALDRALAASGVPRGRTGAIAIDLATGEVVYARNPDLPLAPASNQKLAVTTAALVELGPGFRYETEVVGSGTFDGDTWNGDLLLVGSGDPTLHEEDVRELARRIRAAGIRRVTGRILGDASAFDDRRTAPQWKPGFLGNECAPLSALSVERDWVADPALAAAARLRKALVAAGVEVPRKAGLGTAPVDGTSVTAVDSEPLSQILREMNRESDNFLAEMLLKTVGAQAIGKGTTPAGAAVVRRDLAAIGISLDGSRLLDGSGLSYGDRLTARTLSELLVAVWSDARLRRPFVRSLAVAGVNGTLEDRLEKPPAKGRVRGKTGTTSIASTLAGYVGDRYAFAILMNGRPLPAEAARDGQDRFVQLLARQ